MLDRVENSKSKPQLKLCEIPTRNGSAISPDEATAAAFYGHIRNLQPRIVRLSSSSYPLVLTCTVAENHRRSSNHLNLPPSPPKLPILGNLQQLLGTLPHRSLKALSERYGPLIFVYFGNSSAELASEMIKTHDIVVSNRPKTTPANILLYECQDIAFANYGKYWRQVRKICVLELLSVRRVQSFQHVRDNEVSSLINKIRLSCFNEGGPLNLTELLQIVSGNIASRCVLGRKADDEEENIGKSNKLGALSRRLEEQLSAFCIGDMFPSLGWLDVLSGLIGRLNATARALDALLDQVIEEHMNKVSAESGDDGDDDQSDKKDFVDILLQLRNDGMLGAEVSQDNLKAIILDMLVGGTDSTAITLEWTMAELVKNPTTMKRAREEVRRVAKGKLNIDMKDIEKMDYLKCVIKETLRLHPRAPLLVPREIAESVKWRGYDIPAKTRVIVNAWAIQRDLQDWDNPEEFFPDRFLNIQVDCKGQDFQFIRFGAGRRGCPGMSFGLAAVEYVIANLLYWFDWNLPLGEIEENFDLSEVNGMSVHKRLPLHLVPTLYSTYP